MVPKSVENLLTPVPVSGTHIGFSTLRMEPCWMALGQAAGLAAAQSAKLGTPVRKLNAEAIQRELLSQNAVLIFFRDLKPGDPTYAAAQYLGLRGVLEEWEVKPNEKATPEQVKRWTEAAKVTVEPKQGATRGGVIQAIYEEIPTAAGK